MKKILIAVFLSALASCSSVKNKQSSSTDDIKTTIDAWHLAAANSNYKTYFELMTDDAIFIGTDATEHWNKAQFMNYAKPFFDKGLGWNFQSLQRHVYFDKSGETAWFDELLSTQMKLCRGSGVLIKQDGKWKISQYVLSMTIPNDKTNEVVRLKSPIEDAYIETISKSNGIKK